jgi:hypothetical protein
MTHEMGARPSHPDKLAKASTGLHPKVAAILAAGLPTSFDLAQWQPPRFDQNGGSCTAHGLSGAAGTATNAAGNPIGFIVSPDELYKATRALERAVGIPAGGGPMPDLTDSGAELADALGTVQQWGVAPMTRTAANGRYTDTELDTINNEPDVRLLEEAATTLITGAYRVGVSTQEAFTTACGYIAAKIPLYVGFQVDDAFENIQPGQVVGAPTGNIGGHAVYLSGYRTASTGRHEFLLTNSWGDWCSSGQCWVSENWFAATWEAWAIDVQVIRGGK